MKTTFLIAALFAAVIVVFSLPSFAYAQAAPQVRQTVDLQELVRLALREAHKGKFDAVWEIHEEYGDAALPYFADARFDPDLNVRKAALHAAFDSGIPGFAESSLLFLLPMLDDSDADVAVSAASSITDLRRSTKVLQRLDGAHVVRLIKNATARNPNFIRAVPAVLILLARFKQNPSARGLVSHLIKTNRWDVSTAASNPVKWDMTLIYALVARCEIGSITSAQVIKVLSADPKVRSLFLNTVNLTTDETLLRYALSLLYDATIISPEGFDYEGQQICRDARRSFEWATDIELKRPTKNDELKYDAKAIEKLYEFYGLKR